MSDAYYSPDALVHLARPLVLTALPGVGHRWIARALVATTGIPWVDLHRRIEHDLGQALWLAAAEIGLDGLDAADDEALETALRERPSPVVAAGDGTLLSPHRLESILEGADLVYLETDVSDAYWRLQRQEPSNGTPWLPRPLDGIDDLREFWRERRAHWERATLRLDVRGKTQNEILAMLREALPGLQATEPG